MPTTHLLDVLQHSVAVLDAGLAKVVSGTLGLQQLAHQAGNPALAAQPNTGTLSWQPAIRHQKAKACSHQPQDKQNASAVLTGHRR